MTRPWRSLAAAALPLIAPRRCAACDRCAGDAAVCGDCLADLAGIEHPRPARHDGHTVHAAFAYDDPLPGLLHRAKYRGAVTALGVLARLVAGRLGDPPQADVIVAVPLGARRRRERGYNQAHVIATALAGEWGVPCEEGRLVRVRDTVPQVGHDEAWRRANLAGAFAWTGPPPPRRLCIVDDVFTTGATTGAAVAAARAAGGTGIVVAVAARVL